MSTMIKMINNYNVIITQNLFVSLFLCLSLKRYGTVYVQYERETCRRW